MPTLTPFLASLGGTKPLRHPAPRPPRHPPAQPQLPVQGSPSGRRPPSTHLPFYFPPYIPYAICREPFPELPPQPLTASPHSSGAIRAPQRRRAAARPRPPPSPRSSPPPPSHGQGRAEPRRSEAEPRSLPAGRAPRARRRPSRGGTRRGGDGGGPASVPVPAPRPQAHARGAGTWRRPPFRAQEGLVPRLKWGGVAFTPRFSRCFPS